MFLSKGTAQVKVEVQIRTIAMDYWASLEHELVYKLDDEKPATITNELKECAEIINQIDTRMQKIHKTIRGVP